MKESFFQAHRKLFLLNAISLIIFIFLAYIVVFSVSTTKFDAWIMQIHEFSVSDTISTIMEAVSILFHPVILITVAILGFFFLAGIGKRTIATIFIISLVSGVLSSLWLKNIFQIPRPERGLYEWGFGFPSTHATAIAIFLLSFLIALDKKVKDVILHGMGVLVVMGIIFLTGVSRIYLRVHFATDVLAGFTLGTFWATLAFLIYHYIKHRYGN
jgi:undecaprenyl-diphosphatase